MGDAITAEPSMAGWYDGRHVVGAGPSAAGGPAAEDVAHPIDANRAAGCLEPGDHAITDDAVLVGEGQAGQPAAAPRLLP